MAKYCLKSSVRSCRIGFDSAGSGELEARVRFNPNEFLDGNGVIVAFEGDKYKIPYGNNGQVDTGKIHHFVEDAEFRIVGAERIQAFLPFLQPNSEAIVYFEDEEDNPLGIYGVEKRQ